MCRPLKVRGASIADPPVSFARDKLESLELLAGQHFDLDVIILFVRSYLRFKLSPRDLVEMIGERTVSLAYTAIARWVRRH